jgi:broad specificity phosphatase PhoE
MKHVLLIRHTESTANVGFKTSMPQDIELTDAGHKQAFALANDIPQKPDLIITSPYIRTLQTASPLIARFPDTLHEQWSVHEFTYLSPIRCQNTTTEQRVPLTMEYWNRSDPYFKDGDGAESFADFIGRVQSARMKIQQRLEEFIILFSHCLFINALQWVKGQSMTQMITSKDMECFRQYLFTNTINNGQVIDYTMSD